MINDLDYDYWFYTPQEWADRKEEYLLESDLIFASESQIIDFLHYGSTDLGLEEELQDLFEGFGYFFEFGNHWNFGFYKLDDPPPFPSANSSYSSLLRDSRWQKKRDAIRARSQGICENCGAKNTQLDVHHCYYRYGRFPWQYPNASLLHLCKDCHTGRHKIELKFRGFLPQLKNHELVGLRKSIKSGLYWYPREPLFEFIDKIGYDLDTTIEKLEALRELRSHEEDRK